MFLFNSFLTKNKSAFFAVGLASALMNILNLSGSLFMLEVYDRILPSKSIPSLVALVVLLIVLYAFLMGFDALRGRILARISDNMDDALNQKLFRASISAPLLASGKIDGLQIVGDLDQIRQFLSGPGPAAGSAAGTKRGSDTFIGGSPGKPAGLAGRRGARCWPACSRPV